MERSSITNEKASGLRTTRRYIRPTCRPYAMARGRFGRNNFGSHSVSLLGSEWSDGRGVFAHPSRRLLSSFALERRSARGRHASTQGRRYLGLGMLFMLLAPWAARRMRGKINLNRSAATSGAWLGPRSCFQTERGSWHRPGPNWQEFPPICQLTNLCHPRQRGSLDAAFRRARCPAVDNFPPPALLIH